MLGVKRKFIYQYFLSWVYSQRSKSLVPTISTAYQRDIRIATQRLGCYQMDESHPFREFQWVSKPVGLHLGLPTFLITYSPSVCEVRRAVMLHSDLTSVLTPRKPKTIAVVAEFTVHVHPRVSFPTCSDARARRDTGFWTRNDPTEGISHSGLLVTRCQFVCAIKNYILNRKLF